MHLHSENNGGSLVGGHGFHSRELILKHVWAVPNQKISKDSLTYNLSLLYNLGIWFGAFFTSLRTVIWAYTCLYVHIYTKRKRKQLK